MTTAEWVSQQHPVVRLLVSALAVIVIVLGMTGRGLVWLVVTRAGREIAGGILALAFVINLAYSLVTNWS